ncbi:response regulator [Stieleria sp. TO1_6]|uniref:hybrid sensor histidine kinase/response regulator n=1 Tax=Stieleria tagensis TaxID=2956795 RepID=UPI00209B8EEE|nr:hybrid sensor histidine kinase/response regulator [Stieleria tagensis]MCO8124661.1 response regulator [Stieleria tagensis]
MSIENTSSDAFTRHMSELPINSMLADSSADRQPDARRRMNDFSDAIELLAELSQVGLEDIDANLQDAVESLGKLADSVETSLSDFNDDDPDVIDLVNFVVESCSAIREAAFGENQGSMEPGQLELLCEELQVRLETCQANEGFSASSDRDERDGWGSESETSENDSEVVAPSQEEITALLSGLHGSTAAPPATPLAEPSDDADDEPAEGDFKPAAQNQSTVTVAGSSICVPMVDEIELDDELLEAFMDDATRGLESMEQALLDLESADNSDGAVKTIGRELHTIKGASASVGMSNMAAYIHEVEELIRQTQQAGDAVTPDLLLPHVDMIRARVSGEEIPSDTITQDSDNQSDDPAPAQETGAAQQTTVARQPGAANQIVAATMPVKQKSVVLSDSHGDDETVRVKASQLNRLMDMLSELVMLRNQRDTEISELKGIHDELIYSVTRIRMLSHEGEALLTTGNLTDPALAEDGVSFSHLNEVANDVMESAQRLRECYRPVADGNQAVSQFIRNFRLELVQLRRMPVSGLFRRLHRAISDAARTEKKQVRVELIGENTGIERSLQERIFEPLLHIVRNSVSHGIETSDERIANGKAGQGVVTLHAHSGPDLLVIEVHDDGRGLDYDAIRRRGIERGLIEGDKSISRAELARLIFHPGFSTRETANQLSGRGVGMDVVASTLERMRGWVEVESENGSGSMIRLSLPLPSMIQHAMVFRSGGQLFALPAQSVRRTGEFDAACDPVDLNEILALPGAGEADADMLSRRSMIELASGSATVDSGMGGDFALLVDRVLGPEEVVVRPMPPMLKSHPLCIGATLSGMGEVVLLLDPRQLAESSKGKSRLTRPSKSEVQTRAKEQPKVLVVDDSKSARLRVVRALEKYPVTVVQVDDGQAASEMLAKDTFVTVFSDIDMPRMSGLELLRSIKSEPRLESIPVVMISSRSIDTAGKQAREIGAMQYIQKPLLQERFDHVVASLPWATK